MEYEYLTLGLGKLEIEWIKNIVGPQDYFELFQADDYGKVAYYYDDDNLDIQSKQGPGYSRSLSDIKPRLTLLGFPFAKLPSLLDEHMRAFISERKNFSPKKFIYLLKQIDVSKIDWVEHEGDSGAGEFFSRRILKLPEFAAIKSYLEEFPGIDHYIFEQIDPLIILSALAENPKNLGLHVEWRKNGKHISLDKYKTCVVVTEGPTDGEILKKAINILNPEIEDFFDFIDMRNNYPFGGVGNMINFFKGLAKIGTDRKMIFVFDNDTEGNYNFRQLNNIPHPCNMKRFMLPDLPEFAKFKTIEQKIEKEEDVNKRAVAIEMYLDHKYILRRVPKVEWKIVHAVMQMKQGALKSKSKYHEKFILLQAQDYKNYDFSKLQFLIDHFIKEASV